MDKSLAEFAKAHGVKYFLINFTDLSGVQRSKLVPAAAIDEMQSAGAGFAGRGCLADTTRGPSAVALTAAARVPAGARKAGGVPQPAIPPQLLATYHPLPS